MATLDRGEVQSSQSGGTVTSGVPGPHDKRLFRDLVGRRFSRFPFPDAATEWCRPLSEKVAPKARHPETRPEGRRIADVEAIRITAVSGWDADHLELALDFLLPPGVLPEPDAEISPDEQQHLKNMPTSGLAARIEALTTETRLGSSTESSFAWQQLVTGWIDRCNQKYAPKTQTDELVHGTGLLFDTDDYPYSKVVRSEQLDLDYLSRSPRPQ